MATLRSEATVEVSKADLAKVTLGMKALDQNLAPILRHALHKSANRGAAVMRQHVPKRSGRLHDSIKALDVPIFNPGGAGGGGQYNTKITAGGGVPYFDFVVKGTGIYHQPNPHKIWYQERPRNKDGIATMWKAKHEGQKAQPEWIDKGVDAAWRVLVDTTRRLDKEIATYF